ncbi:Vps53 protein [Candida orthopsilosis Co 90-125]|uniref:Vps53 protein n=1 Tax=Candida orthopsilosis (strain 90-125) TaxID=1136231 RepID=H8X246_CANO9|nr:Vps53 protein [Candida orthopsilosis Co 90-125]CCG22767.1 Vps53 protein [Candida orthopsilosis Co 90-125]
MDSYDYDPVTHINNIFDTPEALNHLPQALSHIHQYKLQLNREIDTLKSQYDSSIEVDDDIKQLVSNIKDVKDSADATKTTIASMTSSIQTLDSCKKNLVLSMTVFKRLQMLVNVNNGLKEILSTQNYEEIYQRLGVMKELLQFFQPYKSIDLINEINLMTIYTQNKLVDDIFVDFEEFLKRDGRGGSKVEQNLLYGARTLEMIDEKNKTKLLNWFHNLQLRDLKNIFSQSDEAGSIENLGRRFIYFNKVLDQVKQYAIFPEDWNVTMDIIDEFCKITKSDLASTLQNKKIDSATLLDNLTKTIEFEKKLNAEYPRENEFNISSVFEPYLSIWVQEQDKMLSSKFVEFAATSQLPPELAKDITANIPNIAITSTELFKIYHKLLSQILKLTNGEIIASLARLFNKYLFEYLNRILTPMLPRNDDDIAGVDAIKYLTLLLNTGDYMVGNIDELNEKLELVVSDELKDRLPTLNSDVFLQLVNKSISALLVKLTNDYKPCWREFFNINWQELDSVNDVSSYMIDIKNITIDNLKLILPLIIRDSYVRNFNDKLVELLVTTLANNLKFIKPLTTTGLEQLLLDVISLKDICLNFPHLAQKEKTKSYTKFVTNHFHELESILKILMVPQNMPVENFIESYFELIGGKSIANFTKILNLAKIDKSKQYKYIENYKLQLSIDNDDDGDSNALTTHQNNQLLTNLEDDLDNLSASSTPVSATPGPFSANRNNNNNNNNNTSSGKLSSPDIKSPKLLPRMNQFEKNIRELALTGETHVSKFNENFRSNFGKLFRKEER